LSSNGIDLEVFRVLCVVRSFHEGRLFLSLAPWWNNF